MHTWRRKFATPLHPVVEIRALATWMTQPHLKYTSPKPNLHRSVKTQSRRGLSGIALPWRGLHFLHASALLFMAVCQVGDAACPRWAVAGTDVNPTWHAEPIFCRAFALPMVFLNTLIQALILWYVLQGPKHPNKKSANGRMFHHGATGPIKRTAVLGRADLDMFVLCTIVAYALVGSQCSHRVHPAQHI